MAAKADFKTIPLIDVSALLAKSDDPNMAEDQGVMEVVKQLDSACREAGFFYAKGHGIPESLVQEVRNVTHGFFSLPYEEKCKILTCPEKGYRGFKRMGETVTKGIRDKHEVIEVFREINPELYGAWSEPIKGPTFWPSDPANFAEVFEEYVTRSTDVSRKIMRGIALALGLPPTAFENDKIAADPFWVIRIIGYPGVVPVNEKDLPKNDIGNGAHTDYGLLTLLNQDEDIDALQVRNRAGEWIPAGPIPGAFVCNIGDMLRIISNGLYESTLHQVVNNSPKYRVCVAFFYEPNFDAVIEPLDPCIKRTGGVKKAESASYGKHLVEKVQTNYLLLDRRPELLFAE